METKNPDYSKTAVKLTNPKEVAEALAILQDLKSRASELDALLRDNPLYRESLAQHDLILDQEASIKAAIDDFGSYQDQELGLYAVKYARQSKEYHAEPFELYFPQFAPAVIVKAVNTRAIEGLLKGGLLTEVGLTKIGVLTTKETYAYVIRAEGLPPETTVQPGPSQADAAPSLTGDSPHVIDGTRHHGQITKLRNRAEGQSDD